MRPILALAALLLSLAMGAQAAQSGADGDDDGAFGVFDMPGLLDRQRMAVGVLRSGDPARAAEILASLSTRHPGIAEPHALRALALAAAGEADAAIAALERAVELGFRGVGGLVARPVFDPLHADPRLDDLVRRVETMPPGKPALSEPVPAPIRDGVAPVRESNTGWDAERDVLVPRFRDPEADRRDPPPVVGDDVPAPVSRLLELWHARGAAAGNTGDLYDNRDGSHSRLARAAFPQFAHTEYGPEARARRLHVGLQTRILFDRIVLGNSSTAIKGKSWRSQGRHALTRPGLAERMFRQYVSNHVYVYPEHRDHDPEHGDLFPANTPYFLVSQGSSYTDRPLMRSVAAILAAFRPETKTFLAERGLIAPTVQMIIRRGLRHVRTDAAYLSALAHPTVFRSGPLDMHAMIRRANALEPGEVPPMVRLAVLSEPGPRPGVDHYAATAEQTLFDTPSAIARIFRSTRDAHVMRITAGATRDPNGRALTFHWRLLRGDPDRVRIETEGARRETATLRIGWQGRRTVPGRKDLTSHRVDIAVFADNGEWLSAPAFISVAFPPRQVRAYDAQGRIVSIDYADPDRAGRYADPKLFYRRDWRDTYAYDDEGRLTGWTRTSPDGKAEFAPDGALVVERDGQGRPAIGEAVAYRLERDGEGVDLHVRWEPTGRRHGYAYDGPGDASGRRIPLGQ